MHFSLLPRSTLTRRWFRFSVLLNNGHTIVLRLYEPGIVAALIGAQSLPNVVQAEFLAYGHGVTEPGKGYAVEHAND